MSEYATVALKMNDRDCIVKSLQEIGYKCEIHETPENLVGFQGDVRKQKAHIIVRRKDIGSASNDIGFLRKEDGSFELIISEYDKSIAHGKKLTKDLMQIYAKHRTLKQVAQMGYSVSSQTVDENGRLKIRVRTR